MEIFVCAVALLAVVGIELGWRATPTPTDWLQALAAELKAGRYTPCKSSRGAERFLRRRFSTTTLRTGARVTGLLDGRAVELEYTVFSVRFLGRGCTTHLAHFAVACRRRLPAFRLERRTFALKVRVALGRGPDLVELGDARLNRTYAAAGDPQLLGALLVDADAERAVRQLVGDGLQQLELGADGQLRVSFRSVGVFSRLSGAERAQRTLRALARVAARYEACRPLGRRVAAKA